MRRIIKLVFFAGITIALLVLPLSLGVGIYVYFDLVKDLPQIKKISDYRPKAVTEIYAADGTTRLAEVYEELRYPVTFEEIPRIVREAFLAAEDANFYNHPGVDFISIVRAAWKNLQQQTSVQGASTITQQVVKSLLLTPEKTFRRKAREAILAYRLEETLSKNEIFTIYLNQIYFGSHAYGVKAAARVHFQKELGELSIAEAAFLAGLPQKPSVFVRPEYRDEAIARQRYVIGQMRQNRFISQEEARLAREQEIKVYSRSPATVYAAPYFSTYVSRNLEDFLGEIDPSISSTDPGGYRVVTTVDLKAQEMARSAVQKGLREVDKRRGWRGPIAVQVDPQTFFSSRFEGDSLSVLNPGEIYPAVIRQLDAANEQAHIVIGKVEGKLSFKGSTWARRYLQRIKSDEGDFDKIAVVSPLTLLQPGDVIEVTPKEVIEVENLDSTEPVKREFELEQTPDIEGAFVLQNALTGEVKAMIGGYDFTRSKFNRATQALRQPGSAFKPFIYLTAIDQLDFTPATIVPDSPISLRAGNGQYWQPQNYDHKYIGPITLRTALQRSRNVVSVYLLTKIGINPLVETARKFGISTPIVRDYSVSLGTAEVKLIEMVRAYGAFAAGGWLLDQVVIKEIRDRDGKLIFQHRPRYQEVISEDSAFLMANMMKGVVERGTAQVVKKVGHPIAGKTGTTNEQMDAWFIGYTPEWVAGAWVGFDVKKTIGRYETGGKAAAPIFVYFMNEFLEGVPPVDFEIPDGVIPVLVDAQSGRLVRSGSPSAFLEYFKSGTEPLYYERDMAAPKDYLSSDEF